MGRTWKRLIISALCAAIVVAVLTAAVLTAPLLVDREMVKARIVSKAAQLTGGELNYSRLELSYFPLPHLVARDVRLHRTEAFEARAQELSLYPGIRSILKGRFSINRLVLVAPEIRVPMAAPRTADPNRDSDGDHPARAPGLQALFEGLRNLAGVLDPGMTLEIEAGSLTLTRVDAPDLRVEQVAARVENTTGELALDLSAVSGFGGDLHVIVSVDAHASRADGTLSLTDFNLRPLLSSVRLPWGLAIDDTRLAARIDFTIADPQTLQAQFGIQAPEVAVLRDSRRLDLLAVGAAGRLALDNQQWLLTLDRLQARQPALDLSAVATLRHGSDSDPIRVDLHAKAGALDVAAVGAAARAIAGDRRQVQTAFRVARAGRLTDVTYFAGFDRDQAGWHMNRMTAAGRLAQGRVTIPGIDTDLERLEGDVAYVDKRVDFQGFSGTFVGAAFGELTAGIDWSGTPQLRISSPQVAVDVAPLYAWLTAFEGLSRAKRVVDAVSGTAQVTNLEIKGPLTRPQHWDIDVSGTPQALRVTSPLLPFAVGLSGGAITYAPGTERASGVRVDFLDARLVASHQSEGLVPPRSASWRIDGTLGRAAVDWLGTVLPIPDHLQIKAPVDLAGVQILWDDSRTLSVAGGLKTADGVEVTADITHSPQAWQIRALQFSDGRSQATFSAVNTPAMLELAFSGSIDKRSADRLLRDNQTISGRLEGNFRARLDRAEPLKSQFWGRLAGHGVHLEALTRVPVAVDGFAVEGHGDRLEVVYCEVVREGNRLSLAGSLDHRDGDLRFDLDVEADSVDEAFIRAFQLQPNAAAPDGGAARAVAWVPRGTIRLTAADFRLGRFVWSPLQADIVVDGAHTRVTLVRADLCGIATAGQLEVSPRGIDLQLHPSATGASLQESLDCLLSRPVSVQARYDFSGEIRLPPTRDNPVQSLAGELLFSSENGRIQHAALFMKIFAVLNITELFTGGKSDLGGAGYGYTHAHVRASVDSGTLQLAEILLDGHSLTITGQGSIDLVDQTADVTLLVAPLKTIDRILNRIPLIGFIAGGSLISVPLKVHGPIDNLSVSPMPAAAVGAGLLGLMERTLKAPFRLVEGAADFVSAESAREVVAPDDRHQQGP
ncbi:MAG: AsmA-like C-terminal domain-containing protein [Desulfosarcina sp.]